MAPLAGADAAELGAEPAAVAPVPAAAALEAALEGAAIDDWLIEEAAALEADDAPVDAAVTGSKFESAFIRRSRRVGHPHRQMEWLPYRSEFHSPHRSWRRMRGLLEGHWASTLPTTGPKKKGWVSS